MGKHATRTKTAHEKKGTRHRRIHKRRNEHSNVETGKQKQKMVRRVGFRSAKRGAETAVYDESREIMKTPRNYEVVSKYPTIVHNGRQFTLHKRHRDSGSGQGHINGKPRLKITNATMNRRRRIMWGGMTQEEAEGIASRIESAIQFIDTTLPSVTDETMKRYLNELKDEYNRTLSIFRAYNDYLEKNRGNFIGAVDDKLVSIDERIDDIKKTITAATAKDITPGSDIAETNISQVKLLLNTLKEQNEAAETTLREKEEEARPEPVVAPVPEAEPEAASEPAPDTITEPATDTITESAPETVIEPVAKSVPESTSMTEPVKESVVETAPETVTEPAPKPVTESAIESAPEATPEATPEVTPEVTPEAAPETAPEIAPAPAPAPAVEPAVTAAPGLSDKEVSDLTELETAIKSKIATLQNELATLPRGDPKIMKLNRQIITENQELAKVAIPLRGVAVAADIARKLAPFGTRLGAITTTPIPSDGIPIAEPMTPPEIPIIPVDSRPYSQGVDVKIAMSDNPAENVIITIRPSVALASRGTRTDVINTSENAHNL